MNWINVKDELPKHGQKIIVWYHGQVKFSKYEGDNWFQSIQGLWELKNITHWMPLPEPPKQ